jgi:molybdenum cofactor cytidylyltransferase
MGTCKLLLPWGRKTVLAHLLDQWRGLCAAQIAPVINPSNQVLKAALLDAGFASDGWIENFFPEQGMFSSLQEASRWRGWRAGLSKWVIALGDQPQIQISTLHLLLETAQQNPSRVCQPVFSGRSGHPIIIPEEQFRALAKTDATDLRAYVQEHEDLRLRVAVSDAGVTGDLDSPEDYVYWKGHRGLPSRVSPPTRPILQESPR